jgi:hypothetical protein
MSSVGTTAPLREARRFQSPSDAKVNLSTFGLFLSDAAEPARTFPFIRLAASLDPKNGVNHSL